MSQKAKGGKRGLSRRQFLGLAGAGLASTLPLPLLAKGLLTKESPQEVPPSPPGPRRQWAMVIDLRRCDGCVTLPDTAPGCVQSCILGHYVPEPQQWNQVFEVELPGGGTFFMPVPCQQCENAPCVNVCPVGATYHAPTGAVLIDQKRCIGCRLCLAACPYQRRFFNWGEPQIPPEAHFVKYSPEFAVPAIKGTAIKCPWCEHHTKDGELPHCVTGCPMKAIYWGDLNEDLATNGVELVKLSKFLDENNGFRYKENLGTQPRVWYIPGHGELVGRHPKDKRKPKPVSYPWGGK